MPISTTCPKCEALFRLDDAMAGENVRCQSCQSIFTVPKADARPAETNKDGAASAPVPKKMTAIAAAPKAKSPPKPDKKNSEKTKAGKPPPVSKKSTVASRTPVKSRRNVGKSGSSVGLMALIVLFLGGGLFGCLACAGAGGYYFGYVHDDKPAPPGPIAANDNKGERDKKDADKKDGDKKDQKKDADKKYGDKKDGEKKDGDKKDGDKKDLGKKDGDKKDGEKKDGDKKPPPKVDIINVAFDGDGLYKSENSLTQADALSSNNRRHKIYAVQLQANQKYQLDMVSDQIDSYLILHNHKGIDVRVDDNSGGGRNARIVYVPDVLFPGGSTHHQIEVTTLRGEETGKFTLTIKRISDTFVVKNGPDVGKSLLVNTHKVGGDFTAKELSLRIPLTKGGVVGTEPRWDPQGKFLYWIQELNLYKVGRDGKVEAHVILPRPCRHLALSADGLITFSTADNELLVFDAQTLAARAKVQCSGLRFVVASPAAATAIVLTKEFEFLDLKTSKLTTAKFKGNVNLTLTRAVVMTPDGKFLCVQADNKLCRFRIDGNELTEEGSKLVEQLRTYQFQISPDSKVIAMSNSIVSKKGAKAVNLEVHAMTTWDKPAYTIPATIRQIAFDDEGHAFAMVSITDLRYYPNPDTQPEQYKALPVPVSTIRRLIAAPQGGGCLVLGTTQSFLIEPTGK